MAPAKGSPWYVTLPCTGLRVGFREQDNPQQASIAKAAQASARPRLEVSADDDSLRMVRAFMAENRPD
jgi:hypothetical protein